MAVTPFADDKARSVAEVVARENEHIAYLASIRDAYLAGSPFRRTLEVGRRMCICVKRLSLLCGGTHLCSYIFCLEENPVLELCPSGRHPVCAHHTCACTQCLGLDSIPKPEQSA